MRSITGTGGELVLLPPGFEEYPLQAALDAVLACASFFGDGDAKEDSPARFWEERCFAQGSTARMPAYGSLRDRNRRHERAGRPTTDEEEKKPVSYTHLTLPTIPLV